MKNFKSGFTILEVLLATFIFGLAIASIVGSQNSSRKNIITSKRIFEAVQLAQEKIAEMEIKYQKVIDQGSIESSFTEESGTFEGDYKIFKWKAQLKESSLEITETEVRQMLSGLGVEEDIVDAQIEQQKLVLTNINKAIKENYAELIVSVEWEEFGKINKLPVVTHLIPKKPKVELTTTTDLD